MSRSPGGPVPRGTAPSSNPSAGAEQGPRSIPLLALGVLLVLEGVAMVGITVLLVVSIVTEPSSSISSAIALAVCAAIAAALLIATGRAALASAKWIRSATLVWQALLVLVGLYAFEGPQPRPDIGCALVLPGLIGIVLLFTPSVLDSTRRR